MEKGAVFPLFYLPSVEFFKNMNQFKQESILIEQEEHFPKQTNRNRTSIASPNGRLDLTVPVQKNKGTKGHTPYKDIRIANEDNWQRIHWLSLETSYRSSAYFEFYEDAFAPFYQKKFDFLLDYNTQLLAVLLKVLKMPVNYQFTDVYEKAYLGMVDLRGEMHHKRPSNYQNKPYYQVFEDKYGYLNNLSVVDLLFNQGPQASKFF
jgi:hypothetical protein